MNNKTALEMLPEILNDSPITMRLLSNMVDIPVRTLYSYRNGDSFPKDPLDYFKIKSAVNTVKEIIKTWKIDHQNM